MERNRTDALKDIFFLIFNYTYFLKEMNKFQFPNESFNISEFWFYVLISTFEHSFLIKTDFNVQETLGLSTQVFQIRHSLHQHGNELKVNLNSLNFFFNESFMEIFISIGKQITLNINNQKSEFYIFSKLQQNIKK
jgi:DMSO/TMAO reductase YedYZ heme-binding membrane subunit